MGDTIIGPTLTIVLALVGGSGAVFFLLYTLWMLLDAADAADAAGGSEAALRRRRSSEAADPVQQRGGYRWGGLWRRARGVGGARIGKNGG